MSQDHAPADGAKSRPTHQPGHGSGHGATQPVDNTDRKRRTVDSTSSALLTLREVADTLRVSYWTVRGWAETGKLATVRLPGDGRLLRVERTEVARLIAASRMSV